VWALDTAAKPYQWMHIKPEGETPVARMYATACARADGLLLLCGGRESSNAPMVRETLSLSHPIALFPSPATTVLRARSCTLPHHHVAAGSSRPHSHVKRARTGVYSQPDKSTKNHCCRMRETVHK